MALTVGNIITDRVRILLRDIDAGGIQWKDKELLNWFNEACSEIARIRPEASSITQEVRLVEGCEQSIPVGGSRLLEAVANSVNGVLGRVVRRVTRSTLDNEDPNWMFEDKSDTVYRYAPSLTDPRTFYVYPPSTGNENTGLSIVYGAPPEMATSMDDDVPLPSMYAATIANYVLARAFSKLTESADAQARGANYMQLFNGQMGDTQTTMEQDNAVTRDPNVGA